MGIFRQLLYNEIERDFAAERKKEDLLASPGKIAKQVDAVTEMVYPYSKKPKGLSKYVTKFQGYDEAAAKKGSAMAGFGTELFAAYSKSLADPRHRGKDAGEILSETARSLMLSPRGDKAPRLAEAYQQKLLADTSITNLFGLTGEDTTIKKLPGELFGAVSYDQYKDRILSRKAEGEYSTGPVEAATMGAGFAALGHVGTKILAKKAAGMALGRAIGAGITAAIPLPGARVAAAAILAIPEFKLFDYAANAIGRTDWGKARKGTWKKMGAELLAGGAVLGGASKATGKMFKLARAGIVKGEAYDRLIRAPKAENIIDYHKALRSEALSVEETNKLFESLSRDTKRDLFNTRFEAEKATIARRTESRRTLEGIRKKALGKVAAKKEAERVRRETANTFSRFDDEMTDAALYFSKETLADGKARGIVAGVQRAKELEAAQEAQKIIERTRARKVTKAPKEIKVVSEKKVPSAPVDPKFGTAEIAGKSEKGYSKDEKLAFRKVYMKGRYNILKEEGLIAGTKKLDPFEIERDIQGKVKGVKGYRETDIPATDLLKKDVLTKEEIKAIHNEYTGLNESTGGGIFEEGADEISKSFKGTGKPSDNLFKTIAVIGLGVTGMSAFLMASPDEAEAGIASAVWKPGQKFIKEVGKEMLTHYGGIEGYKAAVGAELKKVGAFGIPVEKGATELKPENFAKHIRMSEEVTKNLEGGVKAAVTRVKSLPLGIGRFFTPYGFSKIFFKEGYSPAVELGHMMSAYHSNSANSIQVVRNILKEVPGLSTKSNYKEIVKAMEPLAKKHSGAAVAAGVIESKLIKYNELADKILTKKPRKANVAKKYAEKVDKLRNEIAKLEVAKEQIAPKYKQFLSELSVVEKDLASKYSTSRISYAAEDTADFVHRPWLKDMLTPEEKVAVSKIKKFHNTYAERMKEARIDTIEHRPYIQHSKHPAWNVKDAEAIMKSLDIAASDVYPFTKFHGRTMFSQQMVPDIFTNMQQYIPDAERRLGWTRFWGRGNNNSWYALSKSNTVRASAELTDFFQRLKDSSIPHPGTTGNKLANTYSAFEVMRLLAFSPSVAFKHVFKLLGTYSTLGFKSGMDNTLDSAIMASRLWRNSPEVKAIYSKFGIKGGKKKLLDDMAHTYLHQGRLLNNIADLELPAIMSQSYIGAFDRILAGINKPGSVPIRAIEAWDRSVSFNTAMEMAAKRGMTAQQATFGIYNTVLNNNFLSGPLNPAWMQHPKIRALFLFQNTAFKIMERRLITAMKTGKAVKLAWKEGKTIIKKDGIREALSQLTDVRRFVKGAENELKRNLIADALGSQRDYFGNSIVRQFMRESLLVGAVVTGGAYLGVDLMPHTAHVPFFVHSRTEPTLATSPITRAAIESYNDWKDEEEEDREFIVTNFLKNWLGSTRGVPQMANKAMRISNDDIPAIYEEGKFPSWIKYLFSVPGRE
jgi:hypothetical protein